MRRTLLVRLEVRLNTRIAVELMGRLLIGVRIAASRKLDHELGIPQSQTPVDEFEYLTRIHYLAPSDGLWGEHESQFVLPNRRLSSS